MSGLIINFTTGESSEFDSSSLMYDQSSALDLRIRSLNAVNAYAEHSKSISYEERSMITG
jgi:hypothetical protein